MNFFKIRNDFIAATKAQEIIIDAMSSFQAACLVGSWDITENSRLKAHDALDAFFDNLAAAYKESARV